MDSFFQGKALRSPQTVTQPEKVFQWPWKEESKPEEMSLKMVVLSPFHPSPLHRGVMRSLPCLKADDRIRILSVASRGAAGWSSRGGRMEGKGGFGRTLSVRRLLSSSISLTFWMHDHQKCLHTSRRNVARMSRPTRASQAANSLRRPPFSRNQGSGIFRSSPSDFPSTTQH